MERNESVVLKTGRFLEKLGFDETVAYPLAGNHLELLNIYNDLDTAYVYIPIYRIEMYAEAFVYGKFKIEKLIEDIEYFTRLPISSHIYRKTG